MTRYLVLDLICHYEDLIASNLIKFLGISYTNQDNSNVSCNHYNLSIGGPLMY